MGVGRAAADADADHERGEQQDVIGFVTVRASIDNQAASIPRGVAAAAAERSAGGAIAVRI